MDCIEERVDIRRHDSEELAKGKRNMELVFKLNHTMPMTEEYNKIIKELFGDRIGEGSVVSAPISGVCFDRINIGKNVFLNSNLLTMARGGITIEDNVQIAANVQLLTNNHDSYDRMILTCKPILIKEGAWIGAGATILPGVSIGKYAIVGASSVVTHDVGDYEVAVGNPAKVIKKLDPNKFQNIIRK